MRLRLSALTGAMATSALMWMSIGYAAGIRPVHLGLRQNAIGLAAQVRSDFTGIDERT